MRMVLYGFLILVVGGLGWIRFAPSKPDVWHVDPHVTAEQDLAGGVRRRVPGDAQTLAELDHIIVNSPRTHRLAGSVKDGHVTYVSRSKWMGFPDYTTVMKNGETLEIYGRLRFGQSDMGVNKKRVDGWIEDLRATAQKL
ncbi:DUF1499 domain-containing protein [Tropicibacter naphthalenivorans]|uniref:DUF1499 domain-containing protein n=1 Tax=Tropicibacter naphthalenivorans TaxID=441103 RepID=A0A0P1GFJ1_9RHOB|nr:DUF1499 domain-containing protein [Tropicibacter naphthalenivorans]CUH80130.1 hypothetical protein TRN7648_02834 [Tropicibacter naphthalenivorans]SMC84797.1 Protein of unknown function [Tropicibacter naphthalenivorans]